MMRPVPWLHCRHNLSRVNAIFVGEDIKKSISLNGYYYLTYNYHHHHHQAALTAGSSTTLSRHQSLSSFALIQCPQRADIRVGVHKKTLLKSSSLLHQQYPAHLVCFTSIVFLDGRQVAAQLLFCGVLLPGNFQNSTLCSCVVSIYLFFFTMRLRS